MFEKIKSLKRRELVFALEYLKDFSARRAAEAAGYAPEHGAEMLRKTRIKDAIDDVIAENMRDARIDATWVLKELVYNHRIARQQGNLPASNNALRTLMTHVSVDAVARAKVDMITHDASALQERIKRGRKRVSGDEDPPSWM